MACKRNALKASSHTCDAVRLPTGQRILPCPAFPSSIRTDLRAGIRLIEQTEAHVVVGLLLLLLLLLGGRGVSGTTSGGSGTTGSGGTTSTTRWDGSELLGASSDQL